MLSTEEVIKEWGLRRLRDRYPNKNIDRNSVTVDFQEGDNAGCETCGYGSTPAGITAYAYDEKHRYIGEVNVSVAYDFTDVLAEFIEIGRET